MADSITVEIRGLKELQDQLATLGQKVQSRVMRGAVASAAFVIRDEAKLIAPEYTGPVQAGHPPPGTLKRAIYAARLASQCTASVEAWLVSVRRGKKARNHTSGGVTSNQDAYYATWVEYGHFTRTPGTTRKEHRLAVKTGVALSMGAKWVPANSYMRKAFEVKKYEAVEVFRKYVNEKVTELVKR